MERSVDVTTGESVAFRYELAGLGSRFFAVIVDLAIQVAVLVAVLVVLALVVAFALPRGAAHGRFAASSAPAATASAILEAFAVFVAFAIFFGYFIVLEWRTGGRTPGKRLCGIRVVRDGGFPLDFGSSVVRNLVRVLEFGLGFYAVSAVSTLLSPRNRRLGDYAAGTIVIRDAGYAAAPVGFELRDAAEGARADGISPERAALVRRYLARRAALAPDARSAVAADIATPIRPQLAASFEHLDDDALLVHLGRTLLRDDAGERA